MRIPVLATALLLLVSGVFGWNNRVRLTKLQDEKQRLLAQVADRGIPIATGKGTSFVTKRPRVNRTEEARKAALQFIGYVKEVTASDIQSPDKATRDRIDDQMERILALDGAQLKILVQHILETSDLNENIKQNLLAFSIGRLSEDHPQEALELIVDEQGLLALLSKKNGLLENLVSGAMGNWARVDLDAARKWCTANPHNLPGAVVEQATSTLILVAQEYNTGLALELVGEFKKNPESFVPQIFASAKRDNASKSLSLELLRQWNLIGSHEETVRDKIFQESLTAVTMGAGGGSADFESTTGWIDNAGLTEEELGFLDRGRLDLGYYIKREETGRWTEWICKTMPGDIAGGRNWELFLSWSKSSPKAAAQWLESAAESPAKNTAARAYAEATFGDDRDAAIQWVLTVPEQDQRMETLERFYAKWPKTAEADRAAAEEFADRYEINR